MDTLVFIAAILLLGGGSTMAAPTTLPTCQSDILNVTMVRCMTENGFTLEEINKLIPTRGGAVNLDANDLRLFCTKRVDYTKASNCIVEEVNRCHLATGFTINISMNQTAQMMGMICDDPNFKMECMPLLTRDPLVLQSCVTANYDFANEMQVKTRQQLTCESGKVGVQCATGILKECDEHTASVFAAAESLAMSSLCGYTSV